MNASDGVSTVPLPIMQSVPRMAASAISPFAIHHVLVRSGQCLSKSDQVSVTTSSQSVTFLTSSSDSFDVSKAALLNVFMLNTGDIKEFNVNRHL